MKRNYLKAMLMISIMIASITGIFAEKATAAAYNAQAAVNYARQYAEGRNPQYKDYGNNDCSNFVSQCLTAGGLPQDNVWNPNAGTDPQTGYNDWTTTALKDYLINKGYQVIWNPAPNQILPGNPVFYSTRSDYATSHTGTNHAAICVSNANGNDPRICAHSTNRLDYPHANMMSYYKGCCTILLNGGDVSQNPAPDGSNPGAPYPIPSGILRPGSRGDSVKWVQECVNQLLGAGIAVDGIYGNDTTYAVRVYQQRNNLEADGIVGSNTTNSMLAAWREAKKPKDTQAPVITNVRIVSQTEDAYTVQCTVTDNVGVTSVKFPTWTDANWQDDIIWYEGTRNGNTASITVQRSKHNNEYGKYHTHIYAYDAAGNQAGSGGVSTELKKKAVATPAPTAKPTAKPTMKPTAGTTMKPTTSPGENATDMPWFDDEGNPNNDYNYTDDNNSKRDKIVCPANPKSLRIYGKKKKICVSWKKVSGADGYIIKYALNKRFTKKAVTLRVTGGNKTFVKLKKCKRGKAYYVKVRAYRKSGNEKILSKFSKVKKISKKTVKKILKGK